MKRQISVSMIILFFILVLMIGLGVIWWIGRQSLFGKSISTTLKRHQFENYNLSLEIPDDWSVYELNNSEVKDKYDQYLVISGSKPAGSYPRIKIFSFEGEDRAFNSLLEWNRSRIGSSYETQLYDVVDGEEYNGEILIYQYTSNEIPFFGEIIIECRDWIGKSSNTSIIVTICGTKLQWDKLNAIYGLIIESIEIK